MRVASSKFGNSSLLRERGLYSARKALRVALSAGAATLALSAGAAFAQNSAADAQLRTSFAGNQDLSLDEQLRQPILFQADSLTLDSEIGIWSAVGNVEVSQQGRVLRSDLVTFDETSGRLIATGNVRMSEPGGRAVYAERMEITGDLKTGVVESLRLILNPNSRLAAARAVREDGNVTVLEKAVYSPCKVCNDGKAPLWQLKSSRVIHDQARQTISYRNARFEVFGVPIAFLPYFSHPDPSVERKTGFLTPSIGNSSELGNLLETPYFIALKPNMDITLSPLFTTREGAVAKAEFRHRTNTGRYSLDGSITYARSFDQVPDPASPNPADPDFITVRSGRKLRGHLFGDGEFRLSNETQVGYQLELTTDDTYLRRFDISQKDRLVSNAYYERYGAQDKTTYNAYFFDGLRQEDDDATTPIVPALVEHRSVFKDPWLGGSFAVDANVLSLFRTEGFDNDLATNGTDTQRVSVAGTWSKSLTSTMGDVVTATALLRGDFYSTSNREVIVGFDNVTGDPILDDSGDETGRVVGLAAIDWRWPFVRAEGTSRQIIEPILQLIYSPEGGNPDEIPNEDSVSFEFDETNLFMLNKAPGLDIWESGTRANLGLRLATFGETFSGSVLIGQTFRLNEQNAFAGGSGITEERSDYVGRISVEAGEYLTLTHRFRLDKDSFDFRRNEIDIDLDTRWIGLRAGYLSIDDDPTFPALEARQEVRVEGRARFSDHWYIRAGGRRDLEDGEMINNYAGLVYEDECTTFEANYKRTFTRDRDIEPSTAIFFRIRLRSVGD